MKLVLLSNVLEHSGFFRCIAALSKQEADLCFLVSGDLLNIFPEPGEDLKGSIFAELYGDWIVPEMDSVVNSHFKQLTSSRFIQPLKDMFYPNGKTFYAARILAKARYKKFFNQLAEAQNQQPFFYIPGNMDYPDLGLLESAAYPHIHQIDQTVIMLGGYKIGALGGIPNTAHPFAKLVEISPYEMAPEEYERRLWGLNGSDILVTHLSPAEYPPLLTFLRETPLKALICRAPFDFKKSSDFRGAMEIEWEKVSQKPIFKIRPFDYPVNRALVIDLATENTFKNQDSMGMMAWTDSIPSGESHCMTVDG